MQEDEWFELTEEQRQAQYRQRAEALNMIVADVREHRKEDCVGAPMCPGGAAGVKVNLVPPSQTGEFLMTCLAGLADREETIEALRLDLIEAGNRRAVEVAELERALASARRDAETGWNAYASVAPRAAVAAHRAARQDASREG